MADSSHDCARKDNIWLPGDMIDYERQEREEYFRFFNLSTDPMCIADPFGCFKRINPAFTRLTGFDESELLAKPFIEFVVPEDRERTAEEMKLQVEVRSSMHFENRYVCKDGRHVHLSWTAYFDREHGVTYAAARDITERKQTEQELRIAAKAFEAQEGIMVTDAGNIILRVNRAFTEITGYTAEEAVGKNPSMLSSGHHDAAYYAAMWSSLRDYGAWQGEIWNRRKSGEKYPEWLTITTVKDDAGSVINYVGMLTDITLRKAAEEEIRYLAFYDPLTGLPNRRLLMDRLQQALTASARHQRHGAVMLLDMDNFKTLNDTLGHDVGDGFLAAMARRLQACVRKGDTVARQGGDEFVVVLEDLSREGLAATQAEGIAMKMLQTIAEPYELEICPGDARVKHRYQSSASIGITLFRDNFVSAEELMKRADTAMYQAKLAGRSTLRFFDPEMQAAVAVRAALEADLREALQESQFLLFFQPQVDEAGGLVGAEALIRWRHPARGLVLPGDFISLAEDTGLILPIGQWVLRTACGQLKSWAARPETAHLVLAVNVSALQFRHPDFFDHVLAALDEAGADPQKLKLELTESLLLDDVEDVITKMEALKAKGVGFALDDFGTGYSSLSYLKRLPLDQLKIDQSFVRHILVDPNDAAIARTIVALAQSMGLGVIAEGVELEGQRRFLAGLGCRFHQGYLFGPPLPVDDFEYLLGRNR